MRRDFWMSALALTACVLVAAVSYLQSATQDTKTNGTARAKTDQYGDPLPEGALSRMGSVRWRHGGIVTFVAVTPDNKAILTASQDNVLRLWDRETGKEIRRFEKPAPEPVQPGIRPPLRRGANQGMSTISLSQDGKTLAALVSLDTIQLWDVATGKQLRQLKVAQAANAPKGVQAGNASILFSPDGKTLAVQNNDRSVRLLETDNGREITHLKPNQPGGARLVINGQFVVANGVAFSPDSKTIAVGESEVVQNKVHAYVKVYEAATGKVIRQIDTATGTSSVTFSPNGKILAYVSGNNIYLCEADTAKEIRKMNFQGGIASLFFSPDSKTLAGRARDKVIHLWETDSGKALHQLGETNPLPNGGNIAFFAFPSAELHDLAFSPDSKLVVSGNGQTLRQWEVGTGKEVPLSGGHTGSVSSLGITPDGKTLFSRASDNTIRRWEAATGKELGQFQVPTGTTTVAFSSDGRTVALSNTDGTIRLLAVDTGKELHRVKGHANGNATLAFSPDGKTFASRGGFDNMIRLFSVATGGELKQMAVSTDAPAMAGGGFAVPVGGIGGLALAFSPDGQSLVASTNNNTTGFRVVGAGQLPDVPENKLKMWDVSTAREIRLIKLPFQRNITQLAVSPDGRLIAAENSDQSISLWEVSSGTERAVLGSPAMVQPNQPLVAFAPVYPVQGQAAAATTLTFSPDGSFLASRGPNNTVRVWDVNAAKEAASFKGHVGAVNAVIFAPDGKSLASGSSDTTILMWDATRLKREPAPATVKLAAKEIEALWEDLKGEAPKAHQSILKLASASKQSVPFLREQLKPTTPPNVKLLNQWIAEIESGNYQTRIKAVAELEKLGELAQPALQKLHDSPPSVEARRRVQPLLEKLATGTLSAEQVRLVRALEVLENQATTEALEVLTALSKGAPGALQTRHAQAILARLSKQACCCED